MGRHRKNDLDLPPKMRRKGKAYYFVPSSTPRKWIALGSDLPNALKQWADLAGRPAPGLTFTEAVLRYKKAVYPKKAPRTRKDNDGEFRHLEAVFGSSPLDSISRRDVAKYHQLRGEVAPIRANREKALLSHLWNFALKGFLTELPNPCTGIENHPEKSRGVYVTDEILLAIVEHADQSLQDAIWLALLTGQRPADVLAMRREAVADGFLAVKQGKTGKRLRLSMDSGLGRLVSELITRERKISGPWLVQDNGQRLTYWQLAKAFQRARTAAVAAYPKLSEDLAAVQFRDIRAKTGTEAADSGGILYARRLLGHASVTMTEAYVRLGDKVEVK